MDARSERFSLTQQNLHEGFERVMTFITGVVALRSGIYGAEQIADFIEPMKQAVESSPTATTILSGIVGTFCREFFRSEPPPLNAPPLTPSAGSSPASPRA